VGTDCDSGHPRLIENTFFEQSQSGSEIMQIHHIVAHVHAGICGDLIGDVVEEENIVRVVRRVAHVSEMALYASRARSNALFGVTLMSPGFLFLAILELRNQQHGNTGHYGDVGDIENARAERSNAHVHEIHNASME